MSLRKTCIVSLLIVMCCSCGQPGAVTKREYFPSGNLKLFEVSMSGSEEPIHIITQRYENGNLELQEYSIGNSKIRLSFRQDSRMQSEERFTDNKLTFARYYSVNG